jgi:4a-hydroxytetrahydrobiopterin dehydratase
MALNRHMRAGMKTRATKDLASLASSKCNCTAETPLLDKDDLDSIQTKFPLWTVQPSEPKSIRRRFKAQNFLAAMAFLNLVAEVAEENNHHPDLSLSNYRDVELTLSTHDAGGLTLNDLILAAKIDMLPVEYSIKWLNSQPPEIKTWLLEHEKI